MEETSTEDAHEWLAVRGKMEKFRMSLQNPYSALNEEADLTVQAIKDNLIGIVTECGIKVGGKIVRQDTGKLSQETEDMIKKRLMMKDSNQTKRIEIPELSRLFNRRNIADKRNYNMSRIEHAVKNGGSLKVVKRKPGIDKYWTYALRDKEGKITTNMDRIVKIADVFYRYLYSRQGNQYDNGRGSSAEDIDIPRVTTEVNNAFEALQWGKAAGDGQVTADLLKDGKQIVLKTLANLYRQWLIISSVPESLKDILT